MIALTRRQALQTLGGGCAALLFGRAAAETRRSRLGIVAYTLGIHQQQGWGGRHAGLTPALAFLEECRRLGAGGIQFPLGPKDAPSVDELRKRAEQAEMRFEAILNPPVGEADVARFERDVRLAKDAGARVARTVLMPGRRYERFKTWAEFREFERRALRSLQWAEPVVSRHRMRLAVENHKDQLIDEKLDLLKRIGSEWIGLCVDVANNFALMEDPLETMRAFAPFAFTVHIKDMAAQAYAEGWLLADVALGDGFLDLKRIVEVLRAAQPAVPFNLEIITRDALKVPVRTDGYWATLSGDRAALMERLEALVKSKPGVEFRNGISQLPVEQQLELEHRNIERSLAYAREHLGI